MTQININERPVEDAESANLLRRASTVLALNQDRPTEVIGRSQGAYLWTLDGRRYVDHALAGGTVVIGHSDPRVDRAAGETSAKVDATEVGLVEEEILVAEKIAGLLPWVERVEFVSTAVEALRQALRIARIATGRSEVLWVRCRHERLARIPRLDGDGDSGIQFASWEDLETITRRLTHRTAILGAVVLEPCLHASIGASPDRDVPQLVRQLTISAGSVLIFDESKSGFGRHLGGYQSIVDVSPDLAVLGEAIGNGYGGAALVGRADLIEETSKSADRSIGPRPSVLAAWLQTLQILEEGGIDHMDQLCRTLRFGIAHVIKDTRAPFMLTGFGSSWTVGRNADGASVAAGGSPEQLQNLLRSAGIQVSPLEGTNHLCVAMSEGDVEETVTAFQDTFEILMGS